MRCSNWKGLATDNLTATMSHWVAWNVYLYQSSHTSPGKLWNFCKIPGLEKSWNLLGCGCNDADADAKIFTSTCLVLVIRS